MSCTWNPFCPLCSLDFLDKHLGLLSVCLSKLQLWLNIDHLHKRDTCCVGPLQRRGLMLAQGPQDSLINTWINPERFPFDPEESACFQEEFFHPELEKNKLKTLRGDLFYRRVDLTTVCVYKNSARYQNSGIHRNQEIPLSNINSYLARALKGNTKPTGDNRAAPKFQ